jgi:choline dehydrogenase-like flavoprotein
MSSTVFFDADDIAILARLCETILPRESDSPSARDEAVHLFLDDYVAHSHPEQQSLWKEGIRTLARFSGERCPVAFADLDDDSAHALVSEGLQDTIADPFLAAFLQRAKAAIVKAYYRTEHGLHKELRVRKVPRAGHIAPGDSVPGDPENDAPAEPLRSHFDVIVVGSGATGSWAAKALVEAGLDVLMLENGDMPPPSPIAKYPYELRFRNMFDNGVLNGTRQPIQTRLWACDEYRAAFFIDDVSHPYEGHEGYTWIRGSRVGGRMNMWGRQVYRYSPRDFLAESHGPGAEPWPFGYEELAPYYSEVETGIGVSGAMDGIATLPDGEFLPPMEFTDGEKHLKTAVESTWPDRRVIMGRTAILTVNHQGRLACRSAGHCYRGCDTQSFFDPVGGVLNGLALRDNFTLRTGAKVTNILLQASSSTARGVAFVDTRTGARHEVLARAVVLAASTIASTRILLSSRSERFPEGIGAGSGVLGKYLHGHVHSVTCSGSVPWLRKPVGIHDEGRSNQIYIPQFQNLSGAAEDRTYFGGFGIEGAVKHYMQPRDLTTRPGIGLALKKSVREDHNPAFFFLTAFGTMQARAENQVRLSDQIDQWGDRTIKVECSYGPNDHAMVKAMRDAVSETASAAGFEIDHITDTPGMPGLCIHEVGTARMGNDPKRSVLDPFNRVWDVPNVLVVDGACFPSSGPQNPTLTMMAISLRAARRLAMSLKARHAGESLLSSAHSRSEERESV